MVPAHIRLNAWLEVAVVLFQLFGVFALCLTRLVPASRWAVRGRTWMIVALIGLGVAGALCGRNDSEFALFAGGTMTVLLIGMTCGSGRTEANRSAVAGLEAGTNLAG